MEKDYNAENQFAEQSDGTVVKNRRRFFPEWYDYLVLAVLFIVSQMIFAAVLAAGGPYEASESVQHIDHHAAAEAVAHGDAAADSLARNTALGYIAGMVAMIIMTLVYRRLRGGHHGRIARFSPRGFDPALLLGGFIVILAANIVVEPLVELLPGTPDYDPLGRGGWALLSTVICAPIFEEFIFRGIILESTRRRFGVIAAWLISSLCFGLAHILPSQVLATCIIGLVLGYVYIRSGSLFSGIVLHALNNALAMLLLILGYGDMTFAELVGPRVYWPAYGIAAVIFAWWAVGACRTLRRMRRTERDNSY